MLPFFVIEFQLTVILRTNSNIHQFLRFLSHFYRGVNHSKKSRTQFQKSGEIQRNQQKSGEIREIKEIRRNPEKSKKSGEIQRNQRINQKSGEIKEIEEIRAELEISYTFF